MRLEGVVTNVTNFGAFVDIGVHQDGLVHISMMSHKFIKDPRELVKAGDVLKVKVLEVDLQRKRIALTMKLDAPPAQGQGEQPGRDRQPRHNPAHANPSPGARPQGGNRAPSRDRNAPRSAGQPRESQSNGAMAEAWAQALKRR